MPGEGDAVEARSQLTALPQNFKKGITTMFPTINTASLLMILCALGLAAAMWKFKIAPFGMMTALAADRDTPTRDGDVFSYPMAVAKIYAGSLVMLNASGNATPGATATGQIAVGRAREQVDNSGGSAADLNIEVEQGIFRWANSASTDAITKAEIGDLCYIVDDQTVAKTNGTNTRSVAGTIVDVDSDGVWVKTVYGDN
jgi:hypothetical protein